MRLLFPFTLELHNLPIRPYRKDCFCISWLNLAKAQEVCGEGGTVGKCRIDGHTKAPLFNIARNN